MLFNDIYNPIPKAVQDPEYVRDFFSKAKLMPYSGSSTGSSHGILKILYDLAALSPSKESVINFISRYGFEGDLTLKKRTIPGIRIEDDSKLEYSDIIKVADALSEVGIDFPMIGNMAKRHVLDCEVCGNYYMVYEEIQVGSAQKVLLKYVHPKSFFYKAQKTASSPVEGVVFRYEWNLKDEIESRFETIGVYPFFTKTKTGRKTIFHAANLRDQNDLYGRPIDISTLTAQYVEYCNNDLAAKVSRKEIVTKYILAFQEEVIGQSGDESNKERAKSTRKILQSSREGYYDPELNEYVEHDDQSQTVAFISYTGEKAPTPIKLEVARDSKWFETTGSSMSNFIFAANGVPKDLASFDKARGTLNSNSGEFILQQFNITDISLIRPKQNSMSRVWNKIFSLIAEFTGKEELNNAGIVFPPKIKDLINETLLIDQQLNKANGKGITVTTGGEE